MIYKYAPCTDYTFENLARRQVICRHHDDFNDPFEFWSIVEEGEPHPDRERARYERALKAWDFQTDYSDDVRTYFEEIRDYQPDFRSVFKGVRISCFCSEPDNLLMWSHYADGLRGICLEFEENKLIAGNDDAQILNVKYADAPDYVDAFEYALALDQIWFCDISFDESADDFWLEERRRLVEIVSRTLTAAFATKPTEWRYEKEARLILQNASDGPVFHAYPEDALRRIIVGQRIADHNRARLEATIAAVGVSVPVVEAARAPTSFRLSLSS